MKKYRIGLVGFAHMHVLDQIKPFLSMPERVEWIGASDIKPMVESEYFESSSRSMNLKLCQEQCGFTRVFEDYRDLLDLKPDLVLVNCENAFHGIIIPEILMRGIHGVVVYGLKANFNHRFGDAEDYASLMVRYPEAVSILEGTWNTISSGYPSGPIVWGEKGALIVENGGDHGIHANVCVYLDRYSTTPSKVYCSDDYPLPEGRSNLAQEVFHHLETGEPVHYTMDLNNNLWSAAMLDAGIRSSRSLKMEEVKTACWTIG